MTQHTGRDYRHFTVHIRENLKDDHSLRCTHYYHVRQYMHAFPSGYYKGILNIILKHATTLLTERIDMNGE